MSLYEARNTPFASRAMFNIAALLILSLLLWVFGAPTFLKSAHASQVTSASDTISDSNPSDTARHTIAFTNTTAVAQNGTLSVTFDPSGGAFSETYSAASSSDFAMKVGATNYSYVATCAGGSNTFTVVGNNYNTGTNEGVTFTVCGTTGIATSSAITMIVGSTTPVITNPSSTNSYVIRIGGTSGNTGDMQIAILPNVTVTASVSTSFTFTVAGLATSTVVNGIPTTGSSTPTALPFNTLVPNASSSLAQTLSVATNAQNGFQVTVQENQPLTSSTGAIIYLFKDGASTTVPTAWTNPSATLDQPQTYGHFGLTSDDADLSADTGSGNNDFTGSKFAGNIINPRVIFAHNGPADGTTQNKGLAHVLYTAEVSSLQSAGNDYTNTLTYVATPTF
ncbi:MAG TPA: hypothetical protein VMU25_04520 [Candidatus Paceibacterota bacterium]|nr:hypothetical protein [Candidatus Paceibacterota bacterium]